VRPRGPDSGQWYLRAPDTTFRSAVDIERAWGFTRGRSDVVVAVLDTGVRFEHPDLGRVANGGVLLPGYDFVSNTTVANDGNGRDGDPSDPGDWVTLAESSTSTFSDCDPSDSSWHGTATASLVAALTDNNLGMAGSAPGVRVLPVRVLGKCYGTDADIQAAMRWAAGIAVPGVPANPNPAKVINMSLGSGGTCNAAYQQAVDEILAKGTVIVAAAGNSAGGPVGTPGNCNGVMAVLALRHAGTKVGFSDLGPQIAISAPGGNCINITAGSPCLYPILAATDSGTRSPETNTWTDSFNITVGTSFSSPIVAGAVGLMLSLKPELTPTQVRQVLQQTARPFPSTGADNGPDDPTPVGTCQAPSGNVEQLQCYCTAALCGAGMLDAGAAVAAVSGPVPRIDISTANPTAGSAVSLSGAASSGSIASYLWELVDGGGIVSGFSSATNASTASLLPTAAGSFTVRLTVSAANGASQSATQVVTVAAAGTPPVTPPADSGGGGVSFWWVMGVLAAALALLRQPPLSAARRA
jgi:serine protease